jgi:hypothetical protein
MTIHNLLNHTSGIQNFDTVKSYEEAIKNGMEVYQLPHTTDDLLRKYCGGLLIHEVGKVFDYNNADLRVWSVRLPIDKTGRDLKTAGVAQILCMGVQPWIKTRFKAPLM